MQSLRDVMADWGAASELAARVELVAAEICNNIAEHGFKGRSAGEVHLHLKQVSPGMHLEITDNGSPPPASLLEGATLPSIDVASLDLPEGGFGWFLIHSETDALHYDQVDGKNRLTLRFAPR